MNYNRIIENVRNDNRMWHELKQREVQQGLLSEAEYKETSKVSDNMMNQQIAQFEAEQRAGGMI